MVSLISKLGKLADLRYWKFYSQRLFKSPASRDRIADLIARGRPHDAADANAGTILRTQGIFDLGTLLTPEQVDDVLTWFKTRPVINHYRQEDGAFLPLSDARHPDGHVANHDHVDIANAPHLIELANRPDILACAEAFLGCKPKITIMSAWWSYPTSKGPQHAENFHRDVDDWRFLKFFVYLTDVGPENGPHVYALNSAGSDLCPGHDRYTDEQVASAFGADNIKVITGKAGTGFLENTFGQHKGTTLQSGIRLLFQIVYGMNAIPGSPTTPVVSRTGPGGERFAALDPYVNQIYVG